MWKTSEERERERKDDVRANRETPITDAFLLPIGSSLPFFSSFSVSICLSLSLSHFFSPQPPFSDRVNEEYLNNASR